MSLVEGAKISEGKINAWKKVSGLRVTETTVTKAERMHT